MPAVSNRLDLAHEYLFYFCIQAEHSRLGLFGHILEFEGGFKLICLNGCLNKFFKKSSIFFDLSISFGKI